MTDKKPPRRPGRPETFRPHKNLEALRVPPQSVEAEQSVLGGLMIAPERLDAVRLLINEADFYRRDHRLIFRGMVELIDKHKPVDSVTLGEWFEASCLSEQIGGPSYLIELHSNTPSAANLLAYAEIVRKKSIERQLIESGTDQVNAGFQPDGKDVDELLEAAHQRLSTLVANARAGDLMRPADLRALAGTKVTPPRFVMAPYFPRRVVTLFGGHGGAGKSTLALVIAAHIAAGKWWASHKVEQGRVTLFSLEDDGRTVGYRLQKIIDEYGLDEEAVYTNFTVFDWSEGDTALAVEKAEFGVHTLEPTALFARMKVAAAGSDLVLIDNASDAYDANENSKRQVRGFFHLLKTGIAMPNDCAVGLLAHIDKNSAKFGAQGNSYSGSAAWHNSARSRIALVSDKDSGLELRHEKANFGAKADALPLLITESGVLVPCAGREPSSTNEGQDAAGVLAAIRAAAVSGTNVGTGRMGPGNSHQLLSTFPALPARLRSAKGKDAFFAALDSLVATGRVVITETYVNRNRRRFYVEAGTEPSSLFIPPHPPTSEPTKPTKVGSGSGRGFGEKGRTDETNETNDARRNRDHRAAAAGDKPEEP